MIEEDITIDRLIANDYKVITDALNKLIVTVDKSAYDPNVSNVRAENESFGVSIPNYLIKDEITGDPLIITIENFNGSYKVTFNKSLENKVKISLPVLSGDITYQIVKGSDGTLYASKYNPSTNKLEFETNKSDSYTVIKNDVTFSDISDKQQEMQDAIKYLASRGIISGTDTNTFSPDKAIRKHLIIAVFNFLKCCRNENIKETLHFSLL